MTNKTWYLIISTLALLCWGCSDFIEKPLKDEKVIIVTPGNGVKTNIYTQTFWWEELVGATGYNLQIVQNKFDSLPIFTLDTITPKTKFKFTLKPGNYEWRVLGVNANGKSEKYTLQSLRIDSASLGIQTVTLNTPNNQFKVNYTEIPLSWEAISGASNYRINVSRNDSIKLNFVQKKSTYTYTAPKDGTYSWRVKALNSKDSTDWSETRSFIIDRLIDTTTLSFPPNKTRVSLLAANTTLALTWTKVTNADNLILNVSRIRTNDKFSKTFSASETSVLFKDLNISVVLDDVIEWSITSKDAAGNEKPTAKWTFTIN